MVWVIVAAAIVVLALGAFVATGRWGEMPEPVNDRQKAHIPERPFSEGFMGELRIPVVAVGYDCAQVDEFLASALERRPAESPLFDVVCDGYDMQAVDLVVERVPRAVVPLAEVEAVEVIPRRGVAADDGITASGGPQCPEDAE